MTRPIIRIHDLASDEIIDREMNDVEYEQYLEDVAKEEARKAEIEAKEVERQAIAERLGLTADELKLLLG